MLSITVYLISACGLIGLALVVFRIFVRRDYLQKGRLTLFSNFLQLLVWGLYLNFPYLYNPSYWPYFWLKDAHVSPILRVTGSVLIVIGLVIVLVVMARFGFLRAFGFEVNVLKQSGFYRLTRNPQIVGGSPIAFGYALRWPSWYALGWVILCAVIAHIMILTEEEHLRSIHGEEYILYCTRVPRYFRFPGSRGKRARPQTKNLEH